ncbi:hypothetical protein [Pontibacter russatus]|uniref:hypothetical protein n=1 Tax=Pontibacter russatus TaxID=2694929 RepID=UPI001379CD7D|nr:hypothetical protein [Pontibacter russatus]
MVTTGTSFFEKLSVVLALVLCAFLTLSMPAVSYASPAGSGAPAAQVAAEDELPFAVTAGEVAAGDAKGVLQLERAPLVQLTSSLLRQVHTAHASSPAVPAFYAFSKMDCGLHSILTKGP